MISPFLLTESVFTEAVRAVYRVRNKNVFGSVCLEYIF